MLIYLNLQRLMIFCVAGTIIEYDLLSHSYQTAIWIISFTIINYVFKTYTFRIIRSNRLKIFNLSYSGVSSI